MYNKGGDNNPVERNENMMEFLTVEQVAEMIGVTEKTLRSYIHKGDLKAYKFGAVWRIAESDLKVFIESKSNIQTEKGDK